MKPLTGLFGVAAACAACCAVPFLPLVLSAAGIGFGLADLPALAVVAGLAASVALLAYALHRRYRAARGCDGACSPGQGSAP